LKGNGQKNYPQKYERLLFLNVVVEGFKSLDKIEKDHEQEK
jgi:hypothetical protein